MTGPALWQGARAERERKLGALMVRRALLRREMDDIEMQMAALEEELTALNRTATLADRLLQEADSPMPNGAAEPPHAD